MAVQRASMRVLVAGVAVALLTLAGCSSDDSGGSAPEDSTKQTSSTTAAPAEEPAALEVEWLDGFEAPDTPDEYNKVGVLKVGDPEAPNVLILEPGTSAGSTYFVPIANDIITGQPDWQVWAIERRQNLIEDQSQLNKYKDGDIETEELFNYYLGYLNDETVTDHFEMVPDDTVDFAKQWGLNVAIEDLKVVVDQANELDGKVVLGGHSLGGSVVTAYATWDFDGEPGADQLDGLVYIDGGSRPEAPTEAETTEALDALDAEDASPWLSFGGITAPYAGFFNSSGSSSALLDPDAPSLGQTSGLLPTDIVPPVPVTNEGQYGYALDVGTSPENLAAAQGNLGAGLNEDTDPAGWDDTGALTPINRFAAMFSGAGIQDADGTEWYFPQRLTNDTRVVANGNANPGQEVLDVHATLGDQLSKDLFIYAFGASLGGPGVTATAQLLADQSEIPDDHLVLLDRSTTYSHNDPAGAAPGNEFLDALLPFLTQVVDG